MIDLDTMIAAKTDQLNADDLRDQPPLTIKITKVVGTGDKDQPLALWFVANNGGNYMPYKPGKSMRRLLREIWGKDGQTFVGRSMTIYCDKSIMFGKLQVGGIRISHIEGITSDTTLALKGTKGAKQGYLVKPLRVEQQRQVEPMPDAIAAAIKAATGQPALVTIRAENETEAWWPHVDRATRARLAEIEQEQQSNGNEDHGRGDGPDAGALSGSDGPEYDGV